MKSDLIMQPNPTQAVITFSRFLVSFQTIIKFSEKNPLYSDEKFVLRAISSFMNNANWGFVFEPKNSSFNLLSFHNMKLN
jgi:hypothetical protein